MAKNVLGNDDRTTLYVMFLYINGNSRITGKFFSEALIFASTNPHYDDRLYKNTLDILEVLFSCKKGLKLCFSSSKLNFCSKKRWILVHSKNAHFEKFQKH